MRRDIYVIEARDKDGQLLLGNYPQPESFFGLWAIKGILEDDMAQAIFRRFPDASLQGFDVPNWPKLIDPNWTARKKTW